MMRSTLILALLAAMVLFAGCGGDENDEGMSRQIVIGVSIPSATHGWTAGVGWWAERALKQYPKSRVKFIYKTAATADDQKQDISNMIAQNKLDGLVVLSFEPAVITPTIADAKNKGIYVVSVDRGLDPQIGDLWVAGDNEAFGRLAAEFMCDKLKRDGATQAKPGKIVILRGMSNIVDATRYNAAMKVFNAAGHVQVVTEAVGQWNFDKACEAMEIVLNQYRDIDAVWAADDDMAEGAEKAIRDAGRQKNIWLFGGGGKKAIVKRIMEGDPMLPATLTYPPSMVAMGIHMCVSNLRDGKAKEVGQFVPGRILLDCEMITPENAEEHYFPNSRY